MALVLTMAPSVYAAKSSSDKGGGGKGSSGGGDSGGSGGGGGDGGGSGGGGGDGGGSGDGGGRHHSHRQHHSSGSHIDLLPSQGGSSNGGAKQFFAQFSDMPANSPVFIISTTMHEDSIHDIVISGEVKNRGTETTNFVQIIATFYDPNNMTVGNKFTYTEPTTLQPGQTAPFTMYVSPSDMSLNEIDHVKYHLDWQK
jgi:hypothetical protein